jgi:hypothetical protein
MHPPLILFAVATLIFGYCFIMKISNKAYSNTVMMIGAVFQVLGGLAAFFKW